MKKIIHSLVFVTTLGFMNNVFAYLATEMTQLANNAELVMMYKQQGLQYINELAMFKDMVQNTTNITNQQWTNISSDIQGVMNIVQQGQSISFAASDIDSKFRAKYPGYQTATNYQNSYKDWSQSSLDALNVALQAANLQSKDFATEEGVLNQLRVMSGSSAGRMQALQVGNQVAVEQVAQLQKLRQLMMSQAQSQNNYLAAERTEKDAQEAQVKELLQYTPRPKVDHQYFKGGTE